jgi:hypothetical protein
VHVQALLSRYLDRPCQLIPRAALLRQLKDGLRRQQRACTGQLGRHGVAPGLLAPSGLLALPQATVVVCRDVSKDPAVAGLDEGDRALPVFPVLLDGLRDRRSGEVPERRREEHGIAVDGDGIVQKKELHTSAAEESFYATCTCGSSCCQTCQ